MQLTEQLLRTFVPICLAICLGGVAYIVLLVLAYHSEVRYRLWCRNNYADCVTFRATLSEKANP